MCGSIYPESLDQGLICGSRHVTEKRTSLCPWWGLGTCPNFDPPHFSLFQNPKQINQDEHHVPTTLQRPSYPGYAPTGGLQEGKCYYSSIIGARTNDFIRID
jgi:hypothetical protein